MKGRRSLKGQEEIVNEKPSPCGGGEEDAGKVKSEYKKDEKKNISRMMSRNIDIFYPYSSAGNNTFTSGAVEGTSKFESHHVERFFYRNRRCL